jgi:AraC-like DNA-binding protein
MFDSPKMASLMQRTPVGAAGTNEIDVPSSPIWALLVSTKAIKQLDFRLGGRQERRAIGAMESHILPPSCESWWASTPEAADGVFHLHIPVDVVSRFTLSEGVPDPLNRLRPSVGLSDIGLAGLAGTAIELLSAFMPPPRLAWESLARTIALRLSQLAGGASVSPPARMNVHDWRLRRAIEFLEADIGADVGLDALSELVGLSPGHLTVLFRSGTGLPPHQWMMQRRLERACDLLMNPRVTITDAAMATGFASSQHLATVFRKRLGVTPTEWRRGRLS